MISNSTDNIWQFLDELSQYLWDPCHMVENVSKNIQPISGKVS